MLKLSFHPGKKLSFPQKNPLVWIWGLCILLFGACALYLPSALEISSKSGSRNLPIYCVDTDQPVVSLTFDGAWDNEDLADILNTLAAHQVHATFFLTGEWIRSFPEDVKSIAAAGHDIGNHGDTHQDMVTLSKQDMAQEILGAHEALENLTGETMDLFRPPYGSYNNTVIQQADSCNYYSIQWSVDSLDWKDYGTQDIVDRVLDHKDLKNGAIILLHNGAKYTANALDPLLTGLKALGYQMIPVSELIYRDHYHMEHDGTQVQDP